MQGALYTGARYGELVAMRVGDVNLDTGQVYIRPGKSGLGRHVPLNAEAFAFFTEAVAGKPGDGIVFTKGGSPWGANHAVRPLAAACEAAKVSPPANFHALRHTFASHLVQAGVSLQVVAKLLGHADTRVTERHYAHLRDDQLVNAVALLPSYGHGPSAVVNLGGRKRQARHGGHPPLRKESS